MKRDEYKYKRQQMSADDPQIQKISHEKKMDMIHGSKLRQDKTKMWLRPDEQDALELVSFFWRSILCNNYSHLSLSQRLQPLK